MGTLWLSPNSLGKLWQSSSPGQTRVPAASGSALRFSTAACGERLTSSQGWVRASHGSFSHPRRTFPESQEKKTPPTSNFSIPAFKVTPASLSRGYKRAHILRAASEPRGFRTGGEKSPYCVDNHLLDLTHAPRRWGSIPLAVRPKPQNKLVKTRPYPLSRTSTHPSSQSSRKAAEYHRRPGQNVGQLGPGSISPAHGPPPAAAAPPPPLPRQPEPNLGWSRGTPRHQSGFTAPGHTQPPNICPCASRNRWPNPVVGSLKPQSLSLVCRVRVFVSPRHI